MEGVKVSILSTFTRSSNEIVLGTHQTNSHYFRWSEVSDIDIAITFNEESHTGSFQSILEREREIAKETV